MNERNVENGLDVPERNLLLIGTIEDEPGDVLLELGIKVSSAGGWVLQRGLVGESCAELDFEFPRHRIMDVYAVLMASGIVLGRDAHLELTEICQCTPMLPLDMQVAAVRVQLALYAKAGAEDFLAMVPGGDVCAAA